MSQARMMAQREWLTEAERVRGQFRAAPLPTVDEIEREKSVIRASWFDSELRAQLGLPPVTASSPMMEASDE